MKTLPFDPADFLGAADAQAELLADALASGDTGYVANALGIIARAKGMSDLARETGLNRQSLYTALAEGGNPTLDTVLRVARAVGLELTVRRVEPNVPA
jgi:probable addiction module antidote protein